MLKCEVLCTTNCFPDSGTDSDMQMFLLLVLLVLGCCSTAIILRSGLQRKCAWKCFRLLLLTETDQVRCIVTVKLCMPVIPSLNLNQSCWWALVRWSEVWTFRLLKCTHTRLAVDGVNPRSAGALCSKIKYNKLHNALTVCGYLFMNKWGGAGRHCLRNFETIISTECKLIAPYCVKWTQTQSSQGTCRLVRMLKTILVWEKYGCCVIVTWYTTLQDFQVLLCPLFQSECCSFIKILSESVQSYCHLYLTHITPHIWSSDK